VFRLYERNRGNLQSIFVGKSVYLGLLATMEVMVQDEG
jgi:hypothetical protein